MAVALTRAVNDGRIDRVAHALDCPKGRVKRAPTRLPTDGPRRSLMPHSQENEGMDEQRSTCRSCNSINCNAMSASMNSCNNKSVGGGWAATLVWPSSDDSTTSCARRR